MTITVQDNFNGTAGTDLSAHTPDTDTVGGGWAQSAANGNELDGSGAAKAATIADTAVISCGSNDMHVSTNYNAGGADNRVTTVFRNTGGTGASRTGYEFYAQVGLNSWTLYRVVSGSATVIGSGSFTFSLSTTYLLEAEASGTAIKCWIGGTKVADLTDSGISTGAYGGIRQGLRTDGNGRWNDFSIDDLAGSFQAAWAQNSTLTQGIEGIASA